MRLTKIYVGGPRFVRLFSTFLLCLTLKKYLNDLFEVFFNILDNVIYISL